MSKKVLILVAIGRTSKQPIPFALPKGYQVVALVRDAAKISIKSDDLIIVTGLPKDIADVRKAIISRKS